MELLFATPYIIKILASLGLILLVYKLSKQLPLSVMCGTIMLALWLRHSVASMTTIASEKILEPEIISLSLIMLQVVWLSTQMSLNGDMKRLVTSVKNLVPQKISIALLPALIGLLPMPGGAIFSAPMVDDIDHAKEISPLLKTKINYWFRHVWEYWWPLYPGVLLAAHISGLSITTLMLLQLPLSLISIAAGYIFLLRKITTTPAKTTESNKRRSLITCLQSLTPIIIIIVCYAGLRIYVPAISEFSDTLPMSIGILIAQIVVQVQRPLPLVEWKKIMLSLKTYGLLLLVLLILIYGAFIKSPLPDGSLLMDHVRNELHNWGIPFFFIIMLIPFICGFTSGIAVGFVGTSFPIVMALIGENPSHTTLLATTVLAYGSGYTGMILSPVHVCLIVSSNHFNTRISDNLYRLIKPALIVLAGSVLLSLCIKQF